MASLPTKSHFVAHPEELDQACAWEHFGGLTLEEAKARFAQNPLVYQEDFMWMGTDAFLFYYPVLEDYLRNAPDFENDDDYESWIISQCIRAQFGADSSRKLLPLIPSIKELSAFVRQNIRRFGGNNKERAQVAAAWDELVEYIDSLQNR